MAYYYYSYLFYTKWNFLFKQEVKFPAVTICNQNAIKNNEIPEHLIDNIYKEIYEVLDEEKKGDEKDTGNVHVRRHGCLDAFLCL